MIVDVFEKKKKKQHMYSVVDPEREVLFNYW